MSFAIISFLTFSKKHKIKVETIRKVMPRKFQLIRRKVDRRFANHYLCSIAGQGTFNITFPFFWNITARHGP